MVARNQLSCAHINDGYHTLYYDDNGIDAALEVAANKSGYTKIRRAAGAMRDVAVARADMARLALLWLVGGWWLDADIVCLDPIDNATFETPGPACLLAWEGAVVNEPSAPLNWAMACSPGHEFPLFALLEAADRVLAFAQEGSFREHCRGEKGAFCAGQTPVLELTGPAMLGDVLLAYSKKTAFNQSLASLRAVREAAGERPDDASTWDTISWIGYKYRSHVMVLPYCFFRSRGCAHLQRRWCVRGPLHFRKLSYCSGTIESCFTMNSTQHGDGLSSTTTL